ncbi:MAG: secondary thiamine-phosphate synthase enzyme YjbQ [Thermodesulfobacteriota bacterium]|nr:secondary thiamine-phosphate synthase enzyme YjbQ [Thermodesulfobacteriota bacterium]
MSPPVLYCDSLQVSLKTGPDMMDVTGKLTAMVQRAGIKDGSLHASIVGSTGSITTIEYEPGVVEDLKRAISRIAPPDIEYEHEKAWHDGNGHSHVQAALLGPSIAIAVRDGALALGTWQQVVVINHDNRARQRRLEVTLVGTS